MHSYAEERESPHHRIAKERKQLSDTTQKINFLNLNVRPHYMFKLVLTCVLYCTDIMGNWP